MRHLVPHVCKVFGDLSRGRPNVFSQVSKVPSSRYAVSVYTPIDVTGHDEPHPCRRTVEFSQIGTRHAKLTNVDVHHQASFPPVVDGYRCFSQRKTDACCGVMGDQLHRPTLAIGPVSSESVSRRAAQLARQKKRRSLVQAVGVLTIPRSMEMNLFRCALARTFRRLHPHWKREHTESKRGMKKVPTCVFTGAADHSDAFADDIVACFLSVALVVIILWILLMFSTCMPTCPATHVMNSVPSEDNVFPS